MYIPYVAFHTTVFERFVAASNHPANVVFLIYIADSVGYLGYATVLVFRTSFQSPGAVLPFFQVVLVVVAIGSVIGLLLTHRYFRVSMNSSDTIATDNEE
jgi:hypothetical protein